jgi:predicted transcriptional regulator
VKYSEASVPLSLPAQGNDSKISPSASGSMPQNSPVISELDSIKRTLFNAIQKIEKIQQREAAALMTTEVLSSA